MFPKKITYRNKKYLAHVRTLRCSVRGCPKPSEAHHTTTGGTGMKGPDTDAIPLCTRHHMEHNQLGKVSFYEKYNLDRWEEVARTLKKWVENLDKT